MACCWVFYNKYLATTHTENMQGQVLVGREEGHLEDGHAQELDGRGPAQEGAHANQGHGGGNIRINDVLQGEAVGGKGGGCDEQEVRQVTRPRPHKKWLQLHPEMATK